MIVNELRMIDISEPENHVQIEIRPDGKVLWVNVDGITVLRICKIPDLIIEDHRNDTRDES